MTNGTQLTATQKATMKAIRAETGAEGWAYTMGQDVGATVVRGLTCRTIRRLEALGLIEVEAMMHSERNYQSGRYHAWTEYKVREITR